MPYTVRYWETGWGFGIMGSLLHCCNTLDWYPMLDFHSPICCITNFNFSIGLSGVLLEIQRNMITYHCGRHNKVYNRYYIFLCWKSRKVLALPCGFYITLGEEFIKQYTQALVNNVIDAIPTEVLLFDPKYITLVNLFMTLFMWWVLE